MAKDLKRELEYVGRGTSTDYSGLIRLADICEDCRFEDIEPSRHPLSGEPINTFSAMEVRRDLIKSYDCALFQEDAFELCNELLEHIGFPPEFYEKLVDLVLEDDSLTDGTTFHRDGVVKALDAAVRIYWPRITKKAV